MAANLAALRNALDRLGFSDEARTYITDVDGQGYSELSEFTQLTDEEVENLCKVTRRPGGTIPNPNGGDPGQPDDIPNPGMAVSLRAENNLKLMCYYLRFKERTSRVVTANDITLANIRALRHHIEWEDTHDDVDPPEINEKDWPKTIEAIEEYLRGCLGVTKIPLAYVIREDPEPNDPPAGGFVTLQDELIARAPIFAPPGAGGIVRGYTATYLTDRAKVWELISNLTREKDCYTYVRPAQRARDGRLAFEGLKGHYLGENNVDNMSSRAERRLKNTTYSGEKRRWNFEKYVKVHMDQHAILEGLVQHGYAGIDERSKVRHLLEGIKTRELDNVKTRIMSDAQLRNDFTRCVNLFQDFIEQSGNHEVRDVTIAAVQGRKQGGGDEEWKNVQPDMSVEDRYYKKEEYDKLSAAKKKALKIMRDKRGGSPKKRKSNDKRKEQGPVKLTNGSIKAIVSALQSATDDATAPTVADDSDDSSDEEVAMKPPSAKKSKPTTNRSNPALKRKKT